MTEVTEEVEEPAPVVPVKGTFVFADGSNYGKLNRKGRLNQFLNMCDPCLD